MSSPARIVDSAGKSVSKSIQLIAGLGNPGPSYEATRHNIGQRFIQALAGRYSGEFRASRFSGQVCELTIDGHRCRLLQPDTFMNESGRSVLSIYSYFRLQPEELLVVHDELDLQLGTVRLKLGGGPGGHKGLRDIIQSLGTGDFARLRFGIGRPQAGGDVTGYVLSRPPPSERVELEAALERSLDYISGIVAGDFEKVMTTLHTQDTGAVEATDERSGPSDANS